MKSTIGKRDTKIKIVRDGLRHDWIESAEPVETVCETWANVQPATGREIEHARAMESQVSHVVEIDFPFKEVKASDRVCFAGRYGERQLNVTAVINVDEADRGLRLFCVEVTE